MKLNTLYEKLDQLYEYLDMHCGIFDTFRKLDDFWQYRLVIVFIYFFFAAAQEAQQTSHFSSAHGTDRPFTFLSMRFLHLKNIKKVNAAAILKCGR